MSAQHKPPARQPRISGDVKMSVSNEPEVEAEKARWIWAEVCWLLATVRWVRSSFLSSRTDCIFHDHRMTTFRFVLAARCFHDHDTNYRTVRKPTLRRGPDRTTPQPSEPLKAVPLLGSPKRNSPKRTTDTAATAPPRVAAGPRCAMSRSLCTRFYASALAISSSSSMYLSILWSAARRDAEAASAKASSSLMGSLGLAALPSSILA